MTPTPEIIALARRFHELGGTKGIELSVGRWAVHPAKDIATLIIHKQDIPVLKVVECIPILIESELWAWLKNITIDLEIYKYGGQLRAWYKGEKMSLVHFQYLHEALYRVAVWVAERMAK